MSDYISKSEMIYKIRGVVPSSQDVDFIVRLIEEQPTLDETEIIRKAFERIVERLEEKKQEYLEGFRVHQENELYGVACGFGDSIKICKEEGGIEWE